ncbi:mRNA-capping enzyme subunit beta [Podochytrium sp. JEL0797]|nr:mRNA-capping enzyme subunit beta [Podochytrium sp. JEL0797]
MSQRYEPSMFRYRPQDDITRYVSEWLSGHITKLDNSPHIEIEAKLGILVDKRSRQRLYISQIESEAVVSSEFMGQFARFQSDMTFVSYPPSCFPWFGLRISAEPQFLSPKDQHGNFNRFLNKAVEDHKGAIKYTHRYELDKFYSPNQPGGERIRVTVDTKSDDVIAVIQKKRIADLNIYSPSTDLDYRISINLEMPADRPYSEQDVLHERNKDRLSYVFQCVQVDLTQVTDSSKGTKNHELECEIAQVETLLREKTKLDNRQPNQFNDIVGVLINNVRALAKESNKFKKV